MEELNILTLNLRIATGRKYLTVPGAAAPRMWAPAPFRLAAGDGRGYAHRYPEYALEPTDPASGPTREPESELDLLRRRMEVLEAVLGESTDPIFNILEDGTYRYVNQAFSGAFGRTPDQVIGRRIWDIFAPEEAGKRMAVVRRAFASGEKVVFDVRVPTAGGDPFYITSVKPVADASGKVASVVCISKDITGRKQVEEERLELIRSLQAALQEVRTLAGLLPICAHCKKIRDDDGYWTQIEEYLTAHTGADFTHGICPDCAQRYFPDAP